MVSYTKKIYFINVNVSWFGYKYSFWDIFLYNAYMHLKTGDSRKIFAIQKNSHTIELDLEQDTEAIFSKFSKQIRQQYKIAENEGLQCYFHQDVDRFVDFFNDFASKKHTFATSRRRIEEVGDNLKISFAEYNGQLLAAHSYLIDKELKIVRHFHSSSKRLDENTDKNLVGRANKFLTVRDILYFKENGYKVFDFGGYAANTTDESLLGINKFKLMFGGTVTPCINYYSFNYWLFKKIANLIGVNSEV
jgi:hypothetical protein